MCRSQHIRKMLAGLLLTAAVSTTHAQDKTDPRGNDATDEAGLQYSDPQTYKLRVAIRIDSPRTNVTRVVATCPIPINWPEQTVKLLSEKKARGSTTRVKKIPGMGAMLLFQVPRINAGGFAAVERIYEITRTTVRFQSPSDELTLPDKLPAKLRAYLKGAPGIEIKNARIKQLAESLQVDGADEWTTARTYYDWVRKNVQFEIGIFRGANSTLKSKKGDCDDMSALFIALCRCSGIPARSVWIEDHAYPEFYLQDKQKKGYWIPVQISGPEWFGQMIETRPILQKGDSIKDSFRRRTVRYIPQSARAFGGSIQLKVERTILKDK